MLLITFFNLIALTSSARILGIIPTPSFSHQIVFWPIWKQLSLRGHNVTLITANPINDPKLTNLTEISIHGAHEIWNPIFENINLLHNPFKIQQTIDPTLEAIQQKFILENEEVRSLVNNETTFDLVMVEIVFPQLLIFGELFKCPTVLMSSFPGQFHIHGALGNSIHPVVYPSLRFPFFRDLSFKERLVSTAYFLDHLLRHVPQKYTRNTEILRKYFGENVPDVAQLLDKVEMAFFNVHPALNGPMLVGPNTIFFGGMVHLKDPKPLPKDLEQFLNRSVEGVVYFSLGSNVKSAFLGQDKFQTIAQALGELPYKVLWKFELDNIPNTPKNIKFVKWSPQQDVLRHPNIRAFVTQGGLQSLEEAIYFHVPIVLLPFFGDQEQNAKKAEHKKIGKAIYHMRNGLHKDELKNAIMEVVEDPSYRQNMKSLAEIIMDEPMTGVEKVVWWSEYVIRHKGAKHLRNPVLDIPLYQYFMLDILAFFILAIVFLLALVVTAFRILKRCMELTVGYVKYKKE